MAVRSTGIVVCRSARAAESAASSDSWSQDEAASGRGGSGPPSSGARVYLAYGRYEDTHDGHVSLPWYGHIWPMMRPGAVSGATRALRCAPARGTWPMVRRKAVWPMLSPEAVSGRYARPA
eukprot:7094445-Prymnesium_polylepis.1